MGVIYKITNLVNDKSYIGQTNNFDRRKIEHFSEAVRQTQYNSKFYNAVRKYGWENFKWEVLYENVSIEKLDLAEICAIYVHDSFYEGYNSTTGGESGFKSLETREKMSQIAKLSFLKGRVVWNKGVPRTEETKKKISQANKGRFAGSKHPLFGVKRPDRSILNKLQKGINNPNFGKPSWNAGLAYERNDKVYKRKIIIEDRKTGQLYEFIGHRQLKAFCKKEKASYYSLIKYTRSKRFLIKETINWGGKR